MSFGALCLLPRQTLRILEKEISSGVVRLFWIVEAGLPSGGTAERGFLRWLRVEGSSTPQFGSARPRASRQPTSSRCYGESCGLVRGLCCSSSQSTRPHPQPETKAATVTSSGRRLAFAGRSTAQLRYCGRHAQKLSSTWRGLVGEHFTGRYVTLDSKVWQIFFDICCATAAQRSQSPRSALRSCQIQRRGRLAALQR
jgi:hypothetical protein